MPSVLSKPIFTYRQKDRPQEYPSKAYTLFDRTAEGEDDGEGGHRNKTEHEVQKTDGDLRYLHQMARTTMSQFRLAADEGGWSERKKFSNFHNHILMSSGAKDTWLEAIEMGNGEDEPPIDPDDPKDGDFEQVAANFFGLKAGQDYPSLLVWDHLRSLKYDKVLEEHGDDPVQFLRQKQVIEKLVHKELAIQEDTEPTEAMRHDSFY